MNTNSLLILQNHRTIMAQKKLGYANQIQKASTFDARLKRC